MEHLLADVRHALRQLSRERGFTIIATLTLGLGIGATTAIFSLVKAVLLDPLPYREPDQVVMIWNPADLGGTTWHSANELNSYRQDVRGLEEIGAYYAAFLNLTSDGEPERVRAAQITPSLLATLGVAPQAGRGFSPEEAEAGSDQVIVLSHGLWQRRYGGRPDLIGQDIEVDGRARTVVGIMPADFRLPLDFREELPTEAWIPLILSGPAHQNWGNRSLIVMGRLRPGVDAGATTRELHQASEGWIRNGYVVDEGNGALFRSAIALPEFVTGRSQGLLYVLLGAVGFVLLIACANVANLLLARAEGRGREIAIRAALGADRGRMVAQLLTESLVLALAGGAVGTVIAFGGSRALAAIRPATLPRAGSLDLDPMVLGFALALSVVTGVLFGLLPALRVSRPNLTGILKDTASGGSGSRGGARLRNSLVVMELATAVILVLGAGLLIRSLSALQDIDRGFDDQDKLTARLLLPVATYPQSADLIGFFRRAEAELGALPGVQAVGSARVLPLTARIGDWSITVEGRDAGPRENPNGDWQVVTPGYFAAMGVPTVRGRALADSDREDSPAVVVINETMAERYWPGQDPIGRRFRLGTLDQPWLTIVGLVGTVRHNAIVEPPRAEMYVLHAQFGMAVGGNSPRAMTLVLRTAGDPMLLATELRRVIRGLDPKLPVADVRTMRDITAAAMAQPRFSTLLLGAFAGLALVLAGIGVYGTIALLVTHRTREIGIRMALGAPRRTVIGLVLRQGAGLAAVGTALGLLGAGALTRLLSSQLYGVTPLDPATFAAVPLLLGVVALLASVVPARRAAGLEPVVTLRQR